MNMLEMTKQIMATIKIKIDNMKVIKNPTPENDLELFNLLQITCLLQHLSSACVYHEKVGHLMSKFSATDGIWVFNPENGYSSCYDKRNIKPLPNGQL